MELTAEQRDAVESHGEVILETEGQLFVGACRVYRVIRSAGRVGMEPVESTLDLATGLTQDQRDKIIAMAAARGISASELGERCAGFVARLLGIIGG